MKATKKFNLELFEESEKVNFYTIHFENDEYSEFEKFLIGHQSIQFRNDLLRIVSWIDKIGETGALERYFRPESKMHDGVGAIPIEVSKLRLYCLRVSDRILILGNGGHKPKSQRSYNDDPHLNDCVEILSQLDKFLKYRKHNETICVVDQTITGNLSFYI